MAILGSLPLIACTNNSNNNQSKSKRMSTKFQLPELGYAANALEPYIDEATVNFHYGKHHNGYTNNLNAALEGHALEGKSIEEVLANINPEDKALRNNGGGYYNHNLYWEVLTPGGGALSADLEAAIKDSFGSVEKFKEEFSQKAATLFGSGWAWLVVGADKKLSITTTPNQDNPLMSKIAEVKGTPILGIDVWEHAYYLKYQNLRPNYIKNFVENVNWTVISEKYAAV